MKIHKFIVAAAIALAMPIAAHAAPVVTFDQGLASDGAAVAADRSNIAAISDGDMTTFLSLGVDGTLSYDVSPEILTGASVVEVTFGAINLSFPESAKVFLGGSVVGGVFDSTGATELGEIFNDGTSTGGSITANLGVDSSIFSIAIASSPQFSLITLVDTTIANFSATYAANGNVSDGFDVSNFAVTSVVPLPAAAWMLLAGLGGLAGMRRFRSAA